MVKCGDVSIRAAGEEFKYTIPIFTGKSIDLFVENKNNNSLGKARNTYRRPVGDMLVGLSSVGPPYEARGAASLLRSKCRVLSTLAPSYLENTVVCATQ